VSSDLRRLASRLNPPPPLSCLTSLLRHNSPEVAATGYMARSRLVFVPNPNAAPTSCRRARAHPPPLRALARRLRPTPPKAVLWAALRLRKSLPHGVGVAPSSSSPFASLPQGAPLRRLRCGALIRPTPRPRRSAVLSWRPGVDSILTPPSLCRRHQLRPRPLAFARALLGFASLHFSNSCGHLGGTHLPYLK
jgi:hypothetical protein